jgi:transposase
MEQNLSLGLKAVRIVSMNEHAGLLHVVIEKDSSSASCPHCSNSSSSVKDRRIHTVVVKPIDNVPLSVSVIKKRFFCYNSNCPLDSFTEVIEGLQKKHTYADSFDDLLKDLFQHMDYPTIKKCLLDKHQLSIPSSTIHNKLRNIPPESSLPPIELLSPRFIGIDEFSYAKGHSYAVALINLDRKKIIDAVAGGKTIAAACAVLNSIDTSNVQAVAMDMWLPYKIACKKKLPNASIVIDHFHVIKHINDMLKNIRKRISHDLNTIQASFLYDNRFILLKAKERLSIDELSTLLKLLAIHPEISASYQLKEQLRSFYASSDRFQARLLLWQWVQDVRASRIPELCSAADEFAKNWITEILNFFTFRISNAVTEGKVNKIRVIQRKAYHYVNFSSLRYQILKAER